MYLYLKTTDEDYLDFSIKNDIILKANNDNKIYCYFIDEDESVLDITGATVYFTVKSKPTDLDASSILSKTITTIENPGIGEAIISLTDTETKTLLGNYIYSIVLKKSDGTFKTASEGNILFKREIRITY